MNTNRILLVMYLITSLSAFNAYCQVVWGNIPIKDTTGVHIVMVFPASYEIELHPNNNTTCSTHVTSAGRHYEHIHLNMPLSSSITWLFAKDSSGNDYAVVASYISAFWDSHYAAMDSGYCNIGGLDVTYNCHSYALGGAHTWVQDMTLIDQDDLAIASSWEDCQLLRNSYVHTVKVAAYCVGNSETWSYQIDTEEKNRESDIYVNSWVDRNPLGPSTKMKRK